MLPDASGLVRYVGRKRQSSTTGVLYLGTYISTCMISLYGIVCVWVLMVLLVVVVDFSFAGLLLQPSALHCISKLQ